MKGLEGFSVYTLGDYTLGDYTLGDYRITLEPPILDLGSHIPTLWGSTLWGTTLWGTTIPATGFARGDANTCP